jgi:hypothetical protein
MDPVSLILAALAAGAVAGVQTTATAAIKDAYNGLKELVHRRFSGKPEAAVALSEYENDPDRGKETLRKALIDTGAGTDAELVDHAKQVMQLVDPLQYNKGKYNVQVTGDVQGQIIGDNAHQENQFGPKREQ